MVKDYKISVIITNYRRMENLPQVIEGWKATLADEIVLADCSGKAQTKERIYFEVDDRFRIISFTHDYGTKTDYCLATLTEGDLVVYADDDVVPRPGFIEDLVRGWERNPNSIVGVIGRTFHGPKYKGNTRYYSALRIEKPVEVGFCGVVIMTPRKYIGFDCRDLTNNNLDDFYFTMVQNPKVPKYVVPSKNFENLTEASDKDCMFHNPELTKVRHSFYADWYNKNKEYYKNIWPEEL